MKRCFWILVFFCLSTCAYGEVILIEKVPHIVQKPDFCGEACTAMVLQKMGYTVDQDYVFNQSDVNPLDGRGCYTPELVKALKKIGFDTGDVWFKYAAKEGEKGVESQFQALLKDLKNKIPSLICGHYSESADSSEHIRLVLGYDSEKEEVIYHEPAEKKGAYKRMKKSTFLKIWPLKYKNDEILLIRIPLQEKKIQIEKSGTGFSNADYAQHILKLKKKIPNNTFHIVLQKPFVVIGDESSARVEQRAKNTIKWAVDKLKASYFSKDPLYIIDIWLFKNKTSYRKYTKEIFKDTPSTPFGYYTSRHRALIMNISTGGGTLVHEIVHPFIEANFPNCPSWFNEGLASLYEQCGEKDGQIYGYTNWRLAGLQQAISKGNVPSFQKLTSTTTDEFYNEDRGTNYAQARYLCYYLQEQGLLVKFYKDFVKNSAQDSSGYQTLQSVLGEKDMEAFKKKWEKFVSELKFE